jgi:DNA-binding HxlR family transcriptional regulator
VEYSLTAFGASLEPILLLMRDWGDDYMAQLVALRRERELRAQIEETMEETPA